MPERKYSVAEIDAMRRSIDATFGAGPFDAAERAAQVEDRVRTYMLNGTDPAELKEVEEAAWWARFKMQKQMQAMAEAVRRGRVDAPTDTVGRQ